MKIFITVVCIILAFNATGVLIDLCERNYIDWKEGRRMLLIGLGSVGLLIWGLILLVS